VRLSTSKFAASTRRRSRDGPLRPGSDHEICRLVTLLCAWVAVNALLFARWRGTSLAAAVAPCSFTRA
jgi:hypothetical protein